MGRVPRLQRYYGTLRLPPVVAITAADGSTFSLPRVTGLDLVIEGYAVTADVLFCSAPKFTPLIGRRDLMNAFNFGFDDTYWYYD